MNTGTVAIQAALIAIGIQPGDEVLVPAYTWEGTVGPVLLVNAVPVFVDVDPETYCIDATLIEQAITPKTRAILPVHLGMRFADLDAIMSIAQKHNLKVVEDCAHVHGGMWRGKGAGSIGDLGTFSFQRSKLITCGEGGIVITNNLEYFERVQSYINTGRASVTDKFKHRMIGFNYRLGEFQAAILGPQLERLPEQAEIRRANLEYFESRVQNKPGLGLLRPEPRITRHRALLLCAEIFRGAGEGHPASGIRGGAAVGGHSLRRAFLRAGLPELAVPGESGRFSGIELGAAGAARSAEHVSLPASERAAYHEAIWFPHYLFLGDKEDIDTIAEAIFKTLENIEELRGLEHPAIRNQGLSRADRES